MKTFDSSLSRGPSRRDFLKKSALAAAAVSASPAFLGGSAPATASSNPANNRIRVGFLGVGGQGFNTHVRTVAANAAAWNVEGVAVCDVWKNRVDRALAHLGLPESDGYGDYRKLLERNDVDAVYIGSVDHWHARMAVDAVEAGKHVFVEKPMTRHLLEAFNVYDAVKRTGKVFQLGTHFCSEGHWHRAAKLVREGKTGPLVHAQTSFGRNVPHGEWNYRIDPALTADTVDWQMWLGPVADRPFDPDAFFRWRKYYPYCSGILGDLLSHKLHPLMIATDTLEYPVRVACMGSREITTDRDVPDTTQFMVQFPGGFHAHVLGSTVNEEGLREIIRGHKATLYLGGGRVRLNPERPFAEDLDPEEHRDIPNENHHKNWFDAIRGEAEPNSGIDLAIRGQTIVSMAEISERTGQMLYFDAENRRLTDANGRALEPIDYDSVI